MKRNLEEPLDGHVFFPQKLRIRRKTKNHDLSHLSKAILYQLMNSERFEKAKRNINFDEEKINKIEQKTRGQSNTDLWHHYREPRISSTKECYISYKNYPRSPRLQQTISE